jgi:hypothetical protein
MPMPPSVRPVECRRRVGVGISHIGAVKAAGITARTVCPVGIAAIDEPDRGVTARRRIGQLMEVVSRAGKYRPLVDQIHFRRTGLCDHDHAAAAVCPAAPARLRFRHESHCETRCDRKYTEEPNHPARALPIVYQLRRAHAHAQSSAGTRLFLLLSCWRAFTATWKSFDNINFLLMAARTAAASPTCRSGIRSPGHFTLPGLLCAAYRRGLGGTRRWALCRRANAQHKLEHDPEKACPALGAGWEPVLGKTSCPNKEVERDDVSRKNHPAPTE